MIKILHEDNTAAESEILAVAILVKQDSDDVTSLSTAAFVQMIQNAGIDIDYEGLQAVYNDSPRLQRVINSLTPETVELSGLDASETDDMDDMFSDLDPVDSDDDDDSEPDTDMNFDQEGPDQSDTESSAFDFSQDGEDSDMSQLDTSSDSGSGEVFQGTISPEKRVNQMAKRAMNRRQESIDFDVKWKVTAPGKSIEKIFESRSAAQLYNTQLKIKGYQPSISKQVTVPVAYAKVSIINESLIRFRTLTDNILVNNPSSFANIVDKVKLTTDHKDFRRNNWVLYKVGNTALLNDT